MQPIGDSRCLKYYFRYTEKGTVADWICGCQGFCVTGEERKEMHLQIKLLIQKQILV